MVKERRFGAVFFLLVSSYRDKKLIAACDAFDSWRLRFADLDDGGG